MDKKLKSVYFSATGTTARVVKEICRAIDKEFEERDITLPGNRSAGMEFASEDLVVIGFPVYAGRVPEFLSQYLEKLKGKNTQAVLVAVYGNRDYEDALLELKEIVEKNGFAGIAAGAFIGEHSYSDKIATGRPDDKDLEIARNFGFKIREKIECNENTDGNFKLNVKGNYPYKERGSIGKVAPSTEGNCIACGVCAESCPVEAISFKDFRNADPENCIKCHRCVKSCPVGAKVMKNEIVVDFTKGLVERVGKARKEAELFM